MLFFFSAIKQNYYHRKPQPFQTQHTNTSHFQDGGLMATIFLEFPEGIQMCYKSLSWSPDVGFYLISDIQRRCACMMAPPGYPYSPLTPPLTAGLWAYISQLSPLCGSPSSKETSPETYSLMGSYLHITYLLGTGGSHSSAPSLQCGTILVGPHRTN